MKKTLLRIAAFAACILPVISCQEKNGPVSSEDPYINIVSGGKIEASYEEKVFEVKVESNCAWTIAKTDEEGTAVDWVKCAGSTGKGNMTLEVKVFENKTANPRSATVTLAQGDVKAFIDITQAANPNPEEKPEDPNPPTPPAGDDLSLFFDFTGAPLDGWPTAKGSTHVEGGTQCIYPLDGTDYTFILADCNGASALDVFWTNRAEGKANCLYMASQWRYFGLPAIEGYRLSKVVVNCEFYTASIQPRMGIVKSILDLKVDPSEGDIVPGGDIITWENDGEQYEYALPETYSNTVYYLYAEAKGGFTGLNLVYTKDDSTPEPEPEPEPQTFTFDFTGAPLEGWPTAKGSKHEDGGTPCIYPLDGENFTFILADCNGASALDVFWTNRAEGKTNCLFMASQWRYFGLPAVDGRKLTKVEVECEFYTASIQPKMGIVKSILDLKVDPSEGDFVAGGEILTWETDKEWYTYELTGTEESTVYYIYCEAKGGWKTLKLTYE